MILPKKFDYNFNDNVELAISSSNSSELTEYICFKLLQQKVYLIKFFPSWIMNESFCLKACSEFLVYKYMPDEYKTEENTLAALKYNCYQIKHVPDRFYSENLVMNLLPRNPSLIDHISKDRQTPKMCLYSISKRNDLYGNILIVPSPDFETTKMNLQELLRVEENKSSLVNKIKNL